MSAHTPTIIARTIGQLQNGTTLAALVQHTDGAVEALPSLPLADPCDCCPDGWTVLRHPARAWADELVAAAREEAEHCGTSLHPMVLRAAAAREATAELLAELERETRDLRSPQPPVPAQLPPGAVVLTAEQAALWAQLLDELEPLVIPGRAGRHAA